MANASGEEPEGRNRSRDKLPALKRMDYPSDLPVWIDSLFEKIKAENSILIKGVREENTEAFKRIESAFDTRMQKSEGRIALLEADVAKICKQVENLQHQDNTSVCSLPTTAPRSVDRWQPTKLEIRGICDYENRRVEGISREECEPLYQELLSTLPPILRSQVGPYQLRGIRSFGVTIPVPYHVQREVLDYWRKALEDNAIKSATLRKYKGLFIRPELDPDRLPQYRKLGALKSLVEQMVDGELQAKFVPDFTLYLKKDNVTQFLAQVGKNHQVTWTKLNN